jgi:hypothetical protein
MALPFTGTINVGGIQYTLDPTKLGMNYLYRSYHTFNETFKPVAERSGVPLSRIQQLFIKYFRVEPFVEQDFPAIVPDDKKDLIKIFEAYLKQLEINKSILPDSVISIMFNRTYYKISDILRQLTGKAKDFSKMSVTCQNSKKILGALTPDMRMKMIAEFTWLLSHPDEILSENGCTWADAVAGLVDIRLTDMTIRVMDTKKSKKGQGGGGSLDDMKTHLTSLLMVSNVLQAAKQCGCEDDKDYQELQQSLSKAMLPLFKEIKKLYQPVYSVIEQCMKSNHVKKHKIIMPLLQLQHLSNHFIGTRKEAYGIYRICNAGKRLISYLSSQLQCISATLEKMKPAERRAYHDVQKELSPVSPTSLPKRKAVASSKKGAILPIVQFVTLDGNLTIPPYEQFYRKGSESEKEQFFQVMTDFFTKDNIYMMYSETSEIPLQFYDINFPSIDTADSYIPVTNYDSKRIIENHVLQDFCTFVPHAIYTNAELVLSIFIALKEKRTK